MFPIFVIGFIAGILVTIVYVNFKLDVPSDIKFQIQEETINELKEDIKLLEATNQELRSELWKEKHKEN